jgi:hypothetical protein
VRNEVSSHGKRRGTAPAKCCSVRLFTSCFDSTVEYLDRLDITRATLAFQTRPPRANQTFASIYRGSLCLVRQSVVCPPDMPLMMEEDDQDQLMEDLFGDSGHDPIAATAPPAKGLAQRLDHLAASNCCQCVFHCFVSSLPLIYSPIFSC